MTTEATARAFMSSPHFAVVGASSNPAKFGHKIFSWYIQRSLPATPINPGSATVEAAGGTSHATLPSLAALPDPTHTSVSVITPPRATLEVLREAARLGIPAVWLQPGTFDDAVLRFARGGDGNGGGGEGYSGEVVAGDGGRGSEGWCVLVDGERALKAAGKL
ncbi:hypothetical protein SLS62_009910 [Diatrype stigma]|uniref:CoA-binding domain-containing protein n=1 Tax=Diatrype stigma TaxID=117547 RepID=A0AAN9UDW9_9PEZI